MIDLELANRNKKSPEKPQVMNKEDISEADIESDAEEAGSESPNEEMETSSLHEDREDSEGDGDFSGDADDEGADKSKGNPGWADAMRKILNTKKPKRKKTIVLSKAKRLNEVIPKAEEEEVPFEVQDVEGAVKKEKIVKQEIVEHKKEKRKEKNLGIRIKPSVLEREKESLLKKIATKGVVQLFNVVRQQQLEIDKQLEDAGPTERKREKVLKSIDKRAFLDVLMGGSKSIAVDDVQKQKKEEIEENENSKKIWSVLRDDFVMGAKMKDWNKEEESSDSSAPEGMDSD